MKSVKKIVLGVICVLLIFMATGCGNKTVMSSNDFKTNMENKGYVVEDATSQFEAYGYVSQVYVAINSGFTYQIEFYELSDTDRAVNFFNNNQSIFEDSKGSVSSETSVAMGNYSKYTLTTNGMYKVLSRIENTVIYVNVDEEYKEDVQTILEEFGY